MFEVELEAKTKEEALKLATEKLNASESEIIYHKSNHSYRFSRTDKRIPKSNHY